VQKYYCMRSCVLAICRKVLCAHISIALSHFPRRLFLLSRQNVTRDRYNLDAQMPEQVQFKPAVPRVSVPLVPAELEATWKGDEATKDVSLCEMPPKNKV